MSQSVRSGALGIGGEDEVSKTESVKEKKTQSFRPGGQTGRSVLLCQGGAGGS